MKKERVSASLRISPELARQLSVSAKQSFISRNELIERILTEWADKYGPNVNQVSAWVADESDDMDLPF